MHRWKKLYCFTMLVHFFYFHEFNVQRRILFEHEFNAFQSRILLQNINWRNVQYSVCIISFHYIHAEVQRLTSDSFIQQQFYFKQVLNHQRCFQLYNHDNKTIKRGVNKHKSFSSQISVMNFKLDFKTIKMLSVWLTFSDAQQCSITLNYLVHRVLTQSVPKESYFESRDRRFSDAQQCLITLNYPKLVV